MCASLRRRLKVPCDKVIIKANDNFTRHFAPTKCHNKAISARPMKRLSAAFDQVLLGKTAYCRRPPRPKPNENPSPYVVRLSLCYGIKTSPLSVLTEKSARRILAVTLGKMRFCRALFYYSQAFEKSLALALRCNYFNAVKGAAARCRHRKAWFSVADILLCPSPCKELSFDVCNSYFKE